MSRGAGAPPLPAALSLTALVAILTVVAVELVRCSGPLIDLTLSTGGTLAATWTAALTYAAPGLVAGLLLAVTARRGGSRRALLVGSLLLAVLRLLLQAVDGGPRLVIGLVAVAVALAVWCVTVASLVGREGGGGRAALAVSAGSAAAVGLQLTLGTWDAVWRHSPIGWTVAATLAAGLAATGVLAARDPDSSPTLDPGRLWALGPWLALAAMMLANPAFAAAQTRLPLSVAGPVHGLGLLLAAVLLAPRPARTPRRNPSGHAGQLAQLVALASLVGVVLMVPGGTPSRGPLVLLALLGSQLIAAQLLASALTAPGPRPDVRVERVGPVTGAAPVVGLATIGPLLLYQLDYDVGLPFPNELVLVATAVALGVAALRPTPSAAPTGAAPVPLLVTAAGLLVLGATTTLVTERRPAAQDRGFSGRVMTWNLHYGVTPAGSVDLEAVARVIEAQDPDVVLLQEVSRGWVQGGGADMASWLSNRLDRSFVFGAAADGRFGSVVLARGELESVEVLPLPFGVGPQNRSAVSASTRVGATAVTVTSIHLQHRAAGAATRVQQVQTFLDAVADARPSPRIVGGDLNAISGTPEIELLSGAGFVSALDAVGDPAALTAPSRTPTRRIDWVLGRDVEFQTARVLTDVQLSDHLPLVTATAP